MVIKCPKCNHYVSDTAQTCPHCGFALKAGVEDPAIVESTIAEPPKPEPPVVEDPKQASPPVTPSAPVSAPVAPPPVADQQTGKNNIALYAVIAVLALMVCGLGIYILMDGNKEDAPIVDVQDTQEEIDYAKINGILNEIEEHGFSDPSFTGFCPDVNHPHMIDLGLPSGTKWACCNVGAENPCQEGILWDFRQVEKSKNLPTEEQANELVSSCRFTKTNNGIRVIGANGNCIYFPNNHVWIPSWYPGETGLQTVPGPTCWTRTGEKPWFEVFTPGEIINGTGGNEVKYAARYVGK